MTTSRSRDRVHELAKEVKEIVGALKVERDAVTRISVQSERLDKDRVDSVYNLRRISEALSALDVAHYSLVAANISLYSVQREGNDAD